MLNAKKKRIPISRIKIPASFSKYSPSPEKLIEKTVNYVLNNNIEQIYVDKDFVLFDGYCAYLILKYTGVESVRVVVTKEVKK